MSLTLLSLLCVLVPLFAGPGPVNTRGGGDSPFLLVRLEQLVAGLRAGAFPVRWMPDSAYGLGYPFFDFYAALPYYVAAGFRLLGWGPVLALQVTQALGFLLAALSMAILARRVLRRPAAVTLAVIAYTCAPFHLVNVYVRGDSLSEFYAFVFYPLILWALHRLRESSSPANVALLALSYGGLILTHNLSAVMFSLFVAPYALYLLAVRDFPPSTGARRGAWRAAPAMLGGGLFGLALSATLVLAVMSDLNAVWMGTRDIQTTGFFNYAAQFRGRDLVQTSLLFDYDIAGSTPFAMGLVQTIALAAGTVAIVAGWLRRGEHTSRSRPCTALWVGGLLASTWLITPLSRPLWDNLPDLLLPIVQFPWRFLSVQAIFGALIVGEIARRLPRPWWVAAIGGAILLASAVGALRPEYLPIDDGDVTPERLALFEVFTTNIGTTIRGEYLPASVEPRPYASAVTLNRGVRPAPVALSGTLERAELLARSARSEQWQVTVASDDSRLAFYTLYFPGWRCWIDGQPAGINPLPGSGLISLRVPHGTHQIDLRFGRTVARWVGDVLSLVTLGAIVLLLWPATRRRMAPPKTQRPPSDAPATARRTGFSRASPSAVGGLIAGILVLVAALWAAGRMLSIADRFRTENDLSMDFDRLPLLHHNPQGIDFGKARLASYAYPGQATGGEALDVVLTWAEWDPGLRAQVALVAPSDVHPDLQPGPWPLAQDEASVDGTRTAHTLSVPPDAASGLYYVSVRALDSSGEVRAHNARGQTLGTTYLRPVWVDNPRPAQEGDSILARFGDLILLRDDVQVEADEASWQVKLTWQAAHPIPVNYAYSLHILAADGTDLAHRDLEGGPGYGFWPTSAWPVGQWLTDRVRIAKPASVQAADAAALSVTLYDRSQPGLPALGSAVAPLVEREHVYEAPPMARTVGARFGAAVLLGYDLQQDATSLHLTLHWQAAQRMSTDWTVFAHLFDPETEHIVAQWDAKPLRGAYPTTWWRAGEVVSDEVVLDLADVPAGTYRLGVGLYDAGDRTRPPVTTASGEAVPDGRLILKEVIAVGHSQSRIGN